MPRNSKRTRRQTERNRDKHNMFDEVIIYEASKELQQELYLLHKRPHTPENRREFIKTLKKIVETAYPHVLQQKQALCMLDSSLCKQKMTIHQMYVAIYENREHTEKLFGKLKKKDSHFDVWIRSCLFAIIGMLGSLNVIQENSKSDKIRFRNSVVSAIFGFVMGSLSMIAGRLQYSKRNSKLMMLTKKASRKNQIQDKIHSRRY